MKKYVEERIQSSFYIQKNGSALSLKEELELKNGGGGSSGVTLEGLQEQINKLGEEVALDINELEKRMNVIQSKNVTASNSPFQNTYSTL